MKDVQQNLIEDLKGMLRDALKVEDYAAVQKFAGYLASLTTAPAAPAARAPKAAKVKPAAKAKKEPKAPKEPKAVNDFKHGINTQSAVLDKMLTEGASIEDMMKVRNLGKKSLEEAERKLKDLGLGLRSSDE